MPGFKQVPAGSSYSRITKGRLSQKHRHISTSEAGENKRANRGYWHFFGVWGVCAIYLFIYFKWSKGNCDLTQIRSQSWQIIMQHSILRSFNLRPKIIISRFQNTRSYSCFKTYFPKCVWSSVSWLSKCGRGRQRQADTLSLPYGTFCTAIGVNLHDLDCHWLCYESNAGWGWSITLGGGSWGERTARGARWASVGEAALLPVTHHAPLPDRQPCLACAQWEV